MALITDMTSERKRLLVAAVLILLLASALSVAAFGWLIVLTIFGSAMIGATIAWLCAMELHERELASLLDVEVSLLD